MDSCFKNEGNPLLVQNEVRADLHEWTRMKENNIFVRAFFEFYLY